MAGLGKEVWVMPKIGFLYRVRPASMLRTYPTFPGWIRLSHAFPGLPSNQRFTTMRAVLTPNAFQLSVQDSLRHRISELELSMRETQAELERLSAIEASTTWRATRKLREVAASSPKLSRYVRRVVRAGYRLIRKLTRP
jgi:hypothetical protein